MASAKLQSEACCAILYISEDGGGAGGLWDRGEEEEGEVLDASTWLSEPESTRFLLVLGRIVFL